jgi:hypothetical protein
MKARYCLLQPWACQAVNPRNQQLQTSKPIDLKDYPSLSALFTNCCQFYPQLCSVTCYLQSSHSVPRTYSWKELTCLNFGLRGSTWRTQMKPLSYHIISSISCTKPYQKSTCHHLLHLDVASRIGTSRSHKKAEDFANRKEHPDPIKQFQSS